MAVAFPYKISKLKGLSHEKIVRDFKEQTGGLVQVEPEKRIFPASYADWAETIYNFEARPDDVFICTFPRSGTNWMAEMVWLVCNDLDYETASNVPLIQRARYFDKNLLSNLVEKDSTTENLREVFRPRFDELAAQTTRHFIKTHIPMKLMPHNIKEVDAKVVYVVRNPKDVAVSYCYMQQGQKGFGCTADFETFLQLNKFIHGPYWKHILDGWSHRDDENVHFMFYEDAKLDQENTLKKLADFLGHPLKDEDLPELMKHLHIDTFKKNEAINFKFPGSKQEFVRRGKIGENPEITEELGKKIDEWTEKNLANSDLKFPFC